WLRLRKFLEGFEIRQRTPRHAAIDPRAPGNRERGVKNASGNVSRSIDRHAWRKDTAGKTAGNTYILCDDIAFDLTARFEDYANSVDPPLNPAVDMKVGVRVKHTARQKGGAQM